MSCRGKFNFSSVILYLIFIFSLICEAHHYELGNNITETLYFNSIHNLAGQEIKITLLRENRFNLPELAVTGLRLDYKIRGTGNNLGLFSSGDDLYQENRIQYIHYRTIYITKVYLGFSLSRMAIKGYNSNISGSCRIAIGVTPHDNWELTTGINIGLDNSKFTPGQLDKLWITSSALIGEHTILYGAIESNPYSVTTISLGVHEKISNLLSVQLFFADTPASLGGAVIISHNHLEFDISVQNISPLGWINRVSISFK